MARGVFKTCTNDDKSITLYHSYRGRLIKVVRYSILEQEGKSDDEMEESMRRDAEIFFRGFSR